MHECKQSRGGEHFVCHRVGKLTEYGDNVLLAGNFAVQKIGKTAHTVNQKSPQKVVRNGFGEKDRQKDWGDDHTQYGQAIG